MHELLSHPSYKSFEDRRINKFLSHIRQLPEVGYAERFRPQLKATVFIPNALSRLNTDRLLPNGKSLRLYLHVSPSEREARQRLEAILTAFNVDGTAILPTLAGRRWVILDASGDPQEQIKIFSRIAEMAAHMHNVKLVRKPA